MPLVIDSNGDVLRHVMDSTYYLKNLAKKPAPRSRRNDTEFDLNTTDRNNGNRANQYQPRSRSPSPVPSRPTYSTLPSENPHGGHNHERERDRPRSRSPHMDLPSRLSEAVDRATKYGKRRQDSSRSPGPSRKRHHHEDRGFVAPRRSLSRSQSRDSRPGASTRPHEVISLGGDSDDSDSMDSKRRSTKAASKVASSSYIVEDPEVRVAQENLERARQAAIQRQKQAHRDKERQLREELEELKRRQRENSY